MRVFRSISLPLKYDYAIQRLVSLLETSKKRLQLDIDKDNKKKLYDQPVAAIREEEYNRCNLLITTRLRGGNAQRGRKK